MSKFKKVISLFLSLLFIAVNALTAFVSNADANAINFGNPSNPSFASTNYTIDTYAGTGIAGFNGEKGSYTPSNHSAKSGELYGSRGLSVDANGNLYIADEKSGTVRKVTTGGVMSTISGNGIENGYTPSNYTGKAYGQGMYEPMDIVVEPFGKYVFFLDTDHHIVRMIDDNGNLKTLAGVQEIGSAGGYSDGGGIALSAKFSAPQGIAVDLLGNIYVADTNNHLIRKITTDGHITNIAGTPGIGSFSGDGGQATSATLHRPVGLAFDSNGDLYVADMDNHRIRKIDLSTGIITTVAGSNKLPTNSATEEGIGDDRPATEASLFFPNDIAIDAADNMYIADSANHKIRKVFANTNIITTIAGDGLLGYSGNGGSAKTARLNWPKGIAVDGDGTVYISDTDNNVIRRLIPSSVGKDVVENPPVVVDIPVNNPPVSSNYSINTASNTAVSGNILATDVNNDTLTYFVSTSPAKGTATVNVTTGAYTYTPSNNAVGLDSFLVTISDGKGGSTTSTITVTMPISIEPVSDIPNRPRIYLNFNYAYLYGYEQGTVGADDTIKREEASALLYRLLKQDGKTTGFVRPAIADFTDVAKDRWSFSAIEYMTSISIFDVSTKKVNPTGTITHGEASKIIAYAMGLQPDANKVINFSDLPKAHKYYSCIKALVNAGLLVGYEDGTIRPDALLTRAEYVVIINRLIGRGENYDIEHQSNPYPDLNSSHWAYKDILRASFGFTDDGTGKFIVDPAMKLKRSLIDYN